MSGDGDDKDGKKTLTIMLVKGPYVSEAADMALKTALAARRRGHEVNLFIYLDGAWNAHITGEKDYNNPGEWIRSAIKRGVKVKACERCSLARDLTQDNIIEGIEISGSYSFMEMIKRSDRVLSFGG